MCSEKPDLKEQKLVYVLNEEACKRRRTELEQSTGEEINLFWIPPEKASLLRGVLAKKGWSPDGFYEGNMKAVKNALKSGVPLYPIEAIYAQDMVLHVTTGTIKLTLGILPLTGNIVPMYHICWGLKRYQYSQI